MPAIATALPRAIGRYTLHDEIAAGGMATVHFGKLAGDVGFSRMVAIKRMHQRLAHDPQFVAMFLDEARLASRIHHPNVVDTLDIVADGAEVFIVMEYVRGQSLSALLGAALAAEEPVPVGIAAAVICGVLAGLHGAHEARDKKGARLGLVHRDVSPHNVIVGADGVARIMDFGVATAQNRLHVTQRGQLKGKLAYMAPEQLRGGGTGIDRRVDVYAAGVVLWGMLAGRRLFRGTDVAEAMTEIVRGDVPSLASVRDDVPAALERALGRALAREREERFATASDFAAAVESAIAPASVRAVSAWVERLAGDVLAARDAVVARIEDGDAAVEAAAGASLLSGRASSAGAGGDTAPTRRVPAAALVGGQGGESDAERSFSSLPTHELVRSEVADARETMWTGSHATEEADAALAQRVQRRRTRAARSLAVIAAVAAAVGLMVAAAVTGDGPAAPVAAGPRDLAAATGTAAVATAAPPTAAPSPSPVAAPEPAPSGTVAAPAVVASSRTTGATSGAPAAAAPARVATARPRPPAPPPTQAPGDPGYLPPSP